MIALDHFLSIGTGLGFLESLRELPTRPPVVYVTTPQPMLTWQSQRLKPARPIMYQRRSGTNFLNYSRNGRRSSDRKGEAAT